MTARARLLVLSPLVLIVLMTAAVFPLAALAEEATPPPDAPETATTEEAPPAEATDPAAPADELPPPVETDGTVTESQSNTAELEAAPTDDTSEQPAPTEAAPGAATEENIVAALPQDTELVVLGESGEALPLASNETAEIIAIGDPVWCPAGQLPGGSDCTDSYVSLGGGGGPSGVLDAMEWLASEDCDYADPPAAWCGGAGTIYIAADYNANLEFNPWNIVIDSEDLAEYDFGTDTYTYYFGDLVIQGGWDFDANEHPAGATTTFSYPLTVDWRSDITLNDLIFTAVSTGSHALTVTSNGDITLNRVDMDDNDSAGALLDTCLDDDAESCQGHGSIEVNDSSFNHQYEETPTYYNRTGLEAWSGASITLNHVEASNNDWRGASLHKIGTGPGLISITGGTFSGNFISGLVVEGDNIELDTVLVSGNGLFYGWDGADLDNCIDDGVGGHTCPDDGYIYITDSTFEHNGDSGLTAESVGDISLTGTLFEHNGSPDYQSYGAILDNCLYDADTEACTGSGTIQIQESQFNSNQAGGLQAYSSGAIAMILSEASGNGLDDEAGFWDRGGAALNNEDAEGSPGIVVDQSRFLNNAGVGVFAHSLGDIRLTGSEASGNGSAATDNWWDDSQGVGALLDNCAEIMYEDAEGHHHLACRGSGSVTVENSIFESNEMSGLSVETFGGITLDGIQANSNGTFGAELQNDKEDLAGLRSTGDISITGPSTFGTAGAGNGGSGLQFDSFGNVSLSDVVASYNGFGDMGESGSGYGVTGYTEGEGVSISLTNVTASHNWESGLSLDAYADEDDLIGAGPALGITLTDVVANFNGGVGAVLETDGNVWVDPSMFSNNGDDGLFVYASEALIECSTFTDNDYDGLTAVVDGTITVSGCNFGGNGDDDIDIWDGDLVITAGDCASGGNGGGGDEGDGATGGNPILPAPPTTGGASLNVVNNIAEGQTVKLSCTGSAGTVLMLADRDHVELPCPIEGSATLHREGEDTLPAGMDGGLTYVSGMHLGMTPDPEAVQTLGGTIGLHFAVPSDMQQGTLSVLHWDNGQWEHLSGSLSADGFFEAPHGQTGIYVLAAG